MEFSPKWEKKSRNFFSNVPDFNYVYDNTMRFGVFAFISYWILLNKSFGTRKCFEIFAGKRRDDVC